jgi:hypothetical protein
VERSCRESGTTEGATEGTGAGKAAGTGAGKAAGKAAGKELRKNEKEGRHVTRATGTQGRNRDRTGTAESTGVTGEAPGATGTDGESAATFTAEAGESSGPSTEIVSAPDKSSITFTLVLLEKNENQTQDIYYILNIYL